MGAIVSGEQIDRVMGYVDSGKSGGAKLVAGGERIVDPGFFMQATVFDDVNNSMKIAQEDSVRHDVNQILHVAVGIGNGGMVIEHKQYASDGQNNEEEK